MYTFVKNLLIYIIFFGVFKAYYENLAEALMKYII